MHGKQNYDFEKSFGTFCGITGRQVNFQKDKDLKQNGVNGEIEKLHYIWYLCALNALLGVVGKEVYSKMNKPRRRAFAKCLDNIQQDLDIPSGAKCIVAAMDDKLHELILKKKRKKLMKNDEKAEKPAFLQLLSKGEHSANEKVAQTSLSDWISTSVKKISSYLSELWQSKHLDIRRLQKRSSNLEKLPIKVLDKPPNLKEADDKFALSKSPFFFATKVLTNTFQAVSGKNVQPNTWKRAYADLLSLKKMLDGYKEAAKKHYRLLDSIVGSQYKKKNTLSNEMQQFIGKDTPPLLKNLYGLLDKFGKYNGGQPDLKLFSPRLAPVMPDEDNTQRVMSPNILPLYDEDSTSGNLTVPSLLRLAGIPEKEQDAVMNLIMQISGAQKVISDVLNKLNNASEVNDMEKTKMIKKIKDLNDELHKTFTSRQKSDIAQRKYAFLNKEQLIKVFGEKGSHNVSSFSFDIDEYDKWTYVEKKKALFNTIRSMADWGKPQNDHTRRKRQVTLAPFMFAPPLFRLVILNPVTLSPNIFSPNIFAPLLLTPLTLAPQAGSPRVFSPYVLSPFVLSPQAISPNVFTPYVLSPNVLSPVALTPVVFSPPVLSPNVLNPTLLSGPIFSPLVLSPSVKSKAIWGISLFSPSAFS